MLTAIIMMMALIIPASLQARAPEVSLLICGEGAEIYELEGHAGLRINHPQLGDFTVNWGVFDFNSPNFVYRFVKGETDYIAAAAPTEYFLRAYHRQGRTVRELSLNLDSIQAERITALALENLKPENRVYRYNYVLDNCATRPLEMIEAAIGDTVSLAPNSLAPQDASTFRNVMRHYHRNYPWYQFGIDLALGSGIDRPISERETGFAPVVLEEMVRGAKLTSGEPLTLRDGYLVGEPSDPSPSAGPTPWYLSPLFISLLLLAVAIWVSVVQVKGRYAGARWFDTIYFTVTGLAGLLLTFLIFVSVHEATSPNWLYLWLNPLCFIGAVTPWLKCAKRLEICYQSVNFALLVALSIILLCGIQSPNPAFVPLMLASTLRAATDIYTLCSKRKTSR